jgi:hypothetical protein
VGGRVSEAAKAEASGRAEDKVSATKREISDFLIRLPKTAPYRLAIKTNYHFKHKDD